MTALAGGAVAAAALYTFLARELPTIGPIARERVRVVAPRAVRLSFTAAREEAFWRWLLLGQGAALVGVPAAFVVSTAAFALAHWPQAGTRSVAVHSLTGSVFGALYLAGGFVAALVAHAFYNLLVLAAIEAHGGRARAP